MKCTRCGICCTLFAINLSKEEYASKRFKTMFDEYIEDFQEAELTGANILAQNEDGSCIYLKDKICSIQDDKPQSCRNFFCDETKVKSMKEKIDAAKII